VAKSSEFRHCAEEPSLVPASSPVHFAGRDLPQVTDLTVTGAFNFSGQLLLGDIAIDGDRLIAVAASPTGPRLLGLLSEWVSSSRLLHRRTHPLLSCPARGRSLESLLPPRLPPTSPIPSYSPLLRLGSPTTPWTSTRKMQHHTGEVGQTHV